MTERDSTCSVRMHLNQADQGVEGIVLKRLSAPYLRGGATTAWREIGCTQWGGAPGERRDSGQLAP